MRPIHPGTDAKDEGPATVITDELITRIAGTSQIDLVEASPILSPSP